MIKPTFGSALSIVALGLVAQGCTIASSEFPHAHLTEIQLKDTSFKVVESNLRASDSGVRIFGIGANPSVVNVMEKIREKGGLQGTSRAFANVAQDHRTTYYLGIVTVETIEVSADVIEFSDAK